MEKLAEGQRKKGLGRGLGSLLSVRDGGPLPDIAESKSIQNQHHSSDKLNSHLNTQTSGQVNTHGSKEPMTLNNHESVNLQESAAVSRVWQISVERLQPGEYQPRTVFNDEALDELASSIREKGVLQPLLGRKLESGQVEIVAGERRWRAAQKAGLATVPVILQALKDIDALEIALIENIQREDLNPIEEAEAYQRLAGEFGLTHAQVAQKVGRDRVTVSNSLRLLGLPLEVRKNISSGLVSTGHAKVLLGLKDSREVLKWSARVLTDGLTVRQLESLALHERKTRAGEADVIKAGAINDLQEKLQKTLGFPVEIKYSKGGGRISIGFTTDQELEAIAARLVR